MDLSLITFIFLCIMLMFLSHAERVQWHPGVSVQQMIEVAEPSKTARLWSSGLGRWQSIVEPDRGLCGYHKPNRRRKCCWKKTQKNRDDLNTRLSLFFSWYKKLKKTSTLQPLETHSSLFLIFSLLWLYLSVRWSRYRLQNYKPTF